MPSGEANGAKNISGTDRTAEVAASPCLPEDNRGTCFQNGNAAGVGADAIHSTAAPLGCTKQGAIEDAAETERGAALGNDSSLTANVPQTASSSVRLLHSGAAQGQKVGSILSNMYCQEPDLAGGRGDGVLGPVPDHVLGSQGSSLHRPAIAVPVLLPTNLPNAPAAVGDGTGMFQVPKVTAHSSRAGCSVPPVASMAAAATDEAPFGSHIPSVDLNPY